MMKYVLIIFMTFAVLLSGCSRTASDEHEESEPSPSPEVTLVTPPQTDEADGEPAHTGPLAFFEMSDDLFDFTVMIDGDVFKLPVSLDVFMSYGWESTGDLEGTLLPGDSFSIFEFHRGFFFTRDESYLSVQLTNMSDEIRYLSDATVYAVDTDWLNIVIELPHGIIIGSGRDDVTDAFGDPSDVWESSRYDTLVYRHDSNSFVYLRVSHETDLVIHINIENKIQIESDFINKNAEVFNEVTKREAAYVSPTSLGDDLTSFNVKIAGDLYCIPAPVSEFLNNGWEFERTPPEGIPAHRELRNIDMVKDGTRLSVELFNFSDDLLAVERCFITGIDLYLKPNDDLIMPGGIGLGAEEDELTALFGDLFEITEFTSSRNYRFFPERHAETLRYIYFTVDLTGDNEGLISRITVKNIEY